MFEIPAKMQTKEKRARDTDKMEEKDRTKREEGGGGRVDISLGRSRMLQGEFLVHQ